MPTLLITGANRGIGLELCKQYLGEDWTIHATCRQPENAHDLNKLCQKSNGKLTVHPLDVTNPEQIKNLQQILKSTPIDILLNNAGVHAQDASQFGKSDEATWDEAVHVNLLAPLKMMENFVDHVGDSEQRLIVNMSSKMGSMADNGSGGAYAYRATKAALNAVTVSAAQDLKYRKIKVIVMHPGWVRTDMGGPNGEISVEECATHLRAIFDKLTLKDSGKFLDIDGTEIPW